MRTKLTFEEWKEQFKPIENCKIFNVDNPEDAEFIKRQNSNVTWSVNLDNFVTNGLYASNSDGYVFITEVAVPEGDTVVFFLPEDYLCDWEWGLCH